MYTCAEDAFGDADFDVDARVVDNGIGPYEYWGAKGVHHDWGVETEGGGEVTVTWQDNDISIPTTLKTTHTIQVPVPSSKPFRHSCGGRDDCECADAYDSESADYDVEVTGTLRTARVWQEEKGWVIEASYAWEVK